jgi:hypothetical protein
LVDDVRGVWQYAVPFVAIANGDSYSKASWGVSLGKGQSSYVFKSLVSEPIETDVQSISPWLLLGTFTHNNNPIADTDYILVTIELNLKLSMVVDSNLVAKKFNYIFCHTETPNGDSDPRDIVAINQPSAGFFSIDNVLYTMELSFWFEGEPTTILYTDENKSTVSFLYGRISSEIKPVAEPSTIFLFSSGLICILYKSKK